VHANIKFCFKLKGAGGPARETYKMLGTVYENEVESHLCVFRCFRKIQNETWGTLRAQKDAKTDEEINYTLTRRWFHTLWIMMIQRWFRFACITR